MHGKFITRFLRARASILASVIATVILSVRPSVLVSRPGTVPSPGEIETSGFHL